MKLRNRLSMNFWVGVRTDQRVGLVSPLYPDVMQPDWAVGSGLEACSNGTFGVSERIG